MAGMEVFTNTALVICIVLTVKQASAQTTTPASVSTTTEAAETTTFDPTSNDLILEATKSTIGYGIDKEFDVECLYNRSDKSDKSGVIAMVLEHQPEGKTQFEDIASMIINFFGNNQNPTKVKEYKKLGGVVSGVLTKSGMAESFIKYQWIYPKEEVLGQYKCTVRTMDSFGNMANLEKTITVSHTSVTLPELVEKIVNVDLNLDDVRDGVKRLGNKNSNFREEYEYHGMTYMISRKYWTNPLAAQTVCQNYGASLLEVNDANEWSAVKKFIGAETGPFLIGANNKLDNNYWYNMKNNGLAVIASLIQWAPTASSRDGRHCMALTRMTDAEQWKMDTVQCTGMNYNAYICKYEPRVNKKK